MHKETVLKVYQKKKHTTEVMMIELTVQLPVFNFFYCKQGLRIECLRLLSHLLLISLTLLPKRSFISSSTAPWTASPVLHTAQCPGWRKWTQCAKFCCEGHVGQVCLPAH